MNYSRSKVPGAIAAPTAGFTFYTIASCADINTNKAALADIPGGYTVTDSGTTTLLPNGVSTVGCQVTNGAINVPFNAYGAA